MIRYIEKGDIFRIDGVSSYAHGCNCAGAMGKGIAVQFKSKYPDMYLEYKQLCKENK
ncbi:macro domain-containing protein, partial [Bacteroides fragilis]|nr:macro domain-containing protein [Bacteroides fragilis]